MGTAISDAVGCGGDDALAVERALPWSYALGAYLAFARVGLVDTEMGIDIAHTVLVFPDTYLVVAAAYSSIDLGLHRAAATLGADPWRVFTTVVFPLLLPGLAVGALLATLLSFDESVVSIFLSDLNVVTSREEAVGRHPL